MCSPPTMSKPSNEKAIRTGLLIGGALLVYSIFGKKRPGTYVFNPPSITVPPTAAGRSTSARLIVP